MKAIQLLFPSHLARDLSKQESVSPYVLCLDTLWMFRNLNRQQSPLKKKNTLMRQPFKVRTPQKVQVKLGDGGKRWDALVTSP